MRAKIWVSKCFHTSPSRCDKGTQLPIQVEFILTNELYTAGIFGEWIPFWRGGESWLHKVFTELTVTIHKQAFLQLSSTGSPADHIPMDLSTSLSPLLMLYSLVGSPYPRYLDGFPTYPSSLLFLLKIIKQWQFDLVFLLGKWISSRNLHSNSKSLVLYYIVKLSRSLTSISMSVNYVWCIIVCAYMHY